MPKKRILNALGATLIAGVALTAIVAPPAGAVTPISESSSTPTSPPEGPKAATPTPVDEDSLAGPVSATDGAAGNATVDGSKVYTPSAAPRGLYPGSEVTAEASATTVSGRAAPDGDVYLYFRDGSLFVPPVHTVGGRWSVDIPPTTPTGHYDLYLWLLVDNNWEANSVPLSFDHVQKITATGPTGPITTSTASLTGTGDDGASIRVVENGVELSETTVENGAWSVALAGITVGRHVFTVTHTFEGTVTTNSVVVVRQATDAAKLNIAVPADPAIGYTPNTPFTFTGSAPVSAKNVTVRNDEGTLFATVPVDPATGTWWWTRVNMGTEVYRLTFTAGEGTADEQKVALGAFGPRAEAPTAKPVVFTNPSDPTAGYSSNMSFTFRGKATPGAVLTLQNDKGVVFASGIVVDKNGDWSWTRSNMGTSIWKITAIASSPLGTQQTTLASFAPARGDVVTPLAFTNPADVAAGYPANTAFTFRGTAPKGSTVSLQNDKGVVFASGVVVDTNGNWSWTRSNMGTSIWKITAVATLAGGGQQSVTLAPFAPAK